MTATNSRWGGWVLMLLLVAGAATPEAAQKAREVRPRVLPVAQKPLVTIEWSPDGKRLACLGQGGTLYILGAADGKLLRNQRFPQPPELVRWSPDWKRLAVRNGSGRVQIRDAARWRVVRTLPRRMPLSWGGNVQGMEWSPDGALLAVTDAPEEHGAPPDPKTGKYRLHTSERNVVRVWEVATGRQKLLLRHRRSVGPIQGHDFFQFDVAWRPDGKRIATCLDSNENWSSPLQIWDAATGRRVRKLGDRPHGAANAPAWRPDGKRLAAVWEGVTVWDPATGSKLRTLGDEEWRTTTSGWSPEATAWSPDGRYLAARSFNDWYGSEADNTAPLRVWNVGTGKLVSVLLQKGAYLQGPAWSPDGKRLACAASDGSVRIWDLSFLSARQGN